MFEIEIIEKARHMLIHQANMYLVNSNQISRKCTIDVENRDIVLNNWDNGI